MVSAEIGVVLEWLKRHAWKACIRQKRIPSSNLGHSAKILIMGPLKIPQAEMPAGFFAFKGSRANPSANDHEQVSEASSPALPLAAEY